METEPLNPPSPLPVSKVLKRLNELGINISPDVISVVIAAYEDQLKNNYELKSHIVELFDFSWKKGDSDKRYNILDGFNRTVETLAGDDIYILRAVVAKRKFVHPSRISENQMDLEACEACGILSHCTKVVTNKHNGRLESICNHCLVYDEQMRDEGDRSKCHNCTKLMCEHNPNNNVKQLHA